MRRPLGGRAHNSITYFKRYGRMSTTTRATIAFTPGRIERSKISAEKTLPPQSQVASCGPPIRTKDRTDPRELQVGSAPGRDAGMASSRKGYFAPLLDALHNSRRLQAASVLHQYRHLMAGNHVCEAQDQVTERKIASGGQLDMAKGDYPRIRRSTKSEHPHMWSLIATILAFGIIHIAGGIILLNASTAPPPESSLVAFRGD